MLWEEDEDEDVGGPGMGVPSATMLPLTMRTMLIAQEGRVPSHGLRRVKPNPAYCFTQPAGQRHSQALPKVAHVDVHLEQYRPRLSHSPGMQILPAALVPDTGSL